MYKPLFFCYFILFLHFLFLPVPFPFFPFPSQFRGQGWGNSERAFLSADLILQLLQQLGLGSDLIWKLETQCGLPWGRWESSNLSQELVLVIRCTHCSGDAGILTTRLNSCSLCRTPKKILWTNIWKVILDMHFQVAVWNPTTTWQYHPVTDYSWLPSF